MKKYLKFIVPIVCVLVVVITFILLFNMQSKVEEASNKNNVEIENIVEENEVSAENVVDENEVENEIVEDENTAVDNTTTKENSVQDEVVSSDEDRYSENRQKKAIDLVKKHWGEDDTVYFTNEGINSDEEYVVAVRLKSSTAVTNYFKVNIETGKVEIDY